VSIGRVLQKQKSATGSQWRKNAKGDWRELKQLLEGEATGWLWVLA